jgi:hypothetical protein
MTAPPRARARKASTVARAAKARAPAPDAIAFFATPAAELIEPWHSQLMKNKAAWTYFSQQAPWYHRPAAWRLISPKRDETRARRFAQLAEDSASGRRIGRLRAATRA